MARVSPVECRVVRPRVGDAGNQDIQYFYASKYHTVCRRAGSRAQTGGERWEERLGSLQLSLQLIIPSRENWVNGLSSDSVKKFLVHLKKPVFNFSFEQTDLVSFFNFSWQTVINFTREMPPFSPHRLKSWPVLESNSDRLMLRWKDSLEVSSRAFLNRTSPW